MFTDRLTLGVAPIKRSFLSMEEAKRQKDRMMNRISSILPDNVTLVDIDDLCENGIAFERAKTGAIVQKFASAHIDALFLSFCDFGEEQVAAEIAKAFSVPVLVWGARDERPNNDESRGRDTQCGMFAATKVLRRFDVKYSYICNCETESDEFAKGFDRFLRVAMIVKTVKGLRIAAIGARPEPFMSVATNEAALMRRFGMTVVPISPASITKNALELIEQKNPAYVAYLQQLTSRIDCSAMSQQDMEKIAALKIAIEQLMTVHNCTVAAAECWSAFSALLGITPCVAMGELAAIGLPISCETDINGAITMAILRACNWNCEPVFLADLTIRHPANDNAELLWHCGPFAHSLCKCEAKSSIQEGYGRWELKPGHLTLCRFDDAEDGYYLFAGEGDVTDGPETTGTYAWLEVSDWRKWEQALMFGPYIHHIGGVYGDFTPVLREAARYLDLHFDDPNEVRIHAL